MASLDQVLEVFAGGITLAYGLYAIVTRRIDVGEDDEIWFYGWRAVVVGCACLLTAFVLFSAVANNSPVNWF